MGVNWLIMIEDKKASSTKLFASTTQASTCIDLLYDFQKNWNSSGSGRSNSGIGKISLGIVKQTQLKININFVVEGNLIIRKIYWPPRVTPPAFQ